MRKRYITDIDMIKLANLNSLGKKLEYELDFDYNTTISQIDTIDDFYEHIISPYEKGEQIFYRGERVNKFDRTLIPTLFRNKEQIFKNGELVKKIDADELMRFYASFPEYLDVYRKIIGNVYIDELYSFLAFSQHYFGISPLIDLTKSPYVAMSFALKDRIYFDENPLIYTVEIKNESDYTKDKKTANKWLSDYNVIVLNDGKVENYEDFKFDFKQYDLKKYKEIFDCVKKYGLNDITAPSAKMIDVPTNDLMRFQQGVFLLLTDFSIIGKGYFTKNIQADFSIKKWIINKNICPRLVDILLKERPYYCYETITNLSQVVSRIKNNYENGDLIG